MNQVVAVIPARYDSQRFPGKVLTPLQKKPLLFYVWQTASKAKQIDRVIIATDDKRIKVAAETFGAEVIMTSKKHRCGSDRAAEVHAKIGGKIIVNLQADNFGLTGSGLDATIKAFKKDKQADFGTLGRKIDSDEELFDPNTVKVITDKEGNCLYFSRYPLPYLRKVDNGSRHEQFPFLKHIGIYLFSEKGIRQFSTWRTSRLEKAESLEQLRILENGGRIRLYNTRMKSVSIDTADDLKKIEDIYK